MVGFLRIDHLWNEDRTVRREVNPIASFTLEYPVIAVAIALFCLSVCWIVHFKLEKKPKYLLITQWIVGVVLFINFIREIVLVLVS